MFDVFATGSESGLLRVVAAILATIALIPLLGFIYRYATEKDFKTGRRKLSNIWRKFTVSRTLMYQKIAISFYIIFLVLSFTAPDLLPYDLIRVILFTAFVILFWRVFLTLIKTQNDDDAELERKLYDALKEEPDQPEKLDNESPEAR